MLCILQKYCVDKKLPELYIVLYIYIYIYIYILYIYIYIYIYTLYIELVCFIHSQFYIGAKYMSITIRHHSFRTFGCALHYSYVGYQILLLLFFHLISVDSSHSAVCPRSEQD